MPNRIPLPKGNGYRRLILYFKIVSFPPATLLRHKPKQGIFRQKQVVPVTIACRPKPKEINNQIVKDHYPEAAKATRKHKKITGNTKASTCSKKMAVWWLLIQKTLRDPPTCRNRYITIFTPRNDTQLIISLILERERDIEAVPLPLDGNENPVTRILRLNGCQKVVDCIDLYVIHPDDQICI